MDLDAETDPKHRELQNLKHATQSAQRRPAGTQPWCCMATATVEKNRKSLMQTEKKISLLPKKDTVSYPQLTLHSSKHTDSVHV